jgi:hypothetical protein
MTKTIRMMVPIDIKFPAVERVQLNPQQSSSIDAVGSIHGVPAAQSAGGIGWLATAGHGHAAGNP